MNKLSYLALLIAPDSEDQGVQMSEIGGRLVAVLDGFVAQSQAQLKLNIKIIGLSRDAAREGKEA